MDQRLAEATCSGNIDTLYALLREDPYLLEGIEAVPFIDTPRPLHKSVISKQTRFVMEMMNLKPSFARKLNPDGFSPFHLSVEKNRYELVLRLLKIDPRLALVKGREGMTPLHLAARNGASDLVLALLVTYPACCKDVNVDGQTALHIAVANERIEVLEALIGWLGKQVHRTAGSTENEVLNKKDLYGNTALHVAAYENKDQELEVLLSNKKINPNIRNSNGLTVLDVMQSRGQQMDTEKEKLFLQSGAKQANSLPTVTTMLELYRLPLTRLNNSIMAIMRFRSRITDETRNALLVLSTLVITTTYQMVLQPPGGTNNGKVVMNADTYSLLSMFNISGFLAAFFLVMLMVQGDALILMFVFPVFPCMLIAYMMSSDVISPSDASFMGTLIPFVCAFFVIHVLFFWLCEKAIVYVAANWKTNLWAYIRGEFKKSEWVCYQNVHRVIKMVKK